MFRKILNHFIRKMKDQSGQLTLPMALGASALGSLGGSFLQSSSAKKAAKEQAKATRYAADIQKQMFDVTQGYFAPYRQLGEAALPSLQAVDPTGGASRYLQALESLGGGFASSPTNLLTSGGMTRPPMSTGVPQLPAPATTTPTSTTTTQNLGGGLVKATTGAPQIQSLGGGLMKATVGGAPQIQDLGGGLRKATAGAAPSTSVKAGGPGSVEKPIPLVQQADGSYAPSTPPPATTANQGGVPGFPGAQFSFAFNPDDPTYKFKQQETEKAVNRALASRGLFNSRPGINALAEANKSLISEEAEKQYGRTYGRLTDLFKMASGLGSTEYGKYLDLANIGAGAAAGTGSAATQTGRGIAQSYGQLGQGLANSALAQGQAYSDIASNLGNLPINYMLMNKLFG